jgi:hypothetical protein
MRRFNAPRVGNQQPAVVYRGTTSHTRARRQPPVDLVLVDSPAGPETPSPWQRRRESDRSQPGISVIFCREFTMQTRPKWTVTRQPGGNNKTIPPQHCHALAKRFPYPVTAEIPGAGRYGHISSADHPVRH